MQKRLYYSKTVVRWQRYSIIDQKRDFAPTKHFLNCSNSTRYKKGTLPLNEQMKHKNNDFAWLVKCSLLTKRANHPSRCSTGCAKTFPREESMERRTVDFQRKPLPKAYFSVCYCSFTMVLVLFSMKKQSNLILLFRVYFENNNIIT